MSPARQYHRFQSRHRHPQGRHRRPTRRDRLAATMALLLVRAAAPYQVRLALGAA